MGGVLIYALMPITTFAAYKFGTNGFTDFFIILAIYILAKEKEIQSVKDVIKIALIYSFSIGIKLTSLIAAPTLLLLGFSRVWKGSLKDKVKLCATGMCLVPFFSLFLCFAGCIGGKEEIQKSLDGLYWGISVQNLTNLPTNFRENILLTSEKYFFPNYVLLLLLVCLFYLYFNSRTIDYIIYVVSFIIEFLICSSIIRLSPWFNSMYILSVIFLPLLGLAVFEMIQGKAGRMIAIFVLIGLQINHFGVFTSGSTLFRNYIKWNYTNKQDIELGDTLYSVLLENRKDNLNTIWEDYTLPLFVNELMYVSDKNNEFYMRSIWESFHLMDEPIDYIAIDLRLLDEKSTKERIDELRKQYPNEADEYEQKVITDRKMKKEFIEDPIIRGEKYQCIFQNDICMFYMKEGKDRQ